MTMTNFKIDHSEQLCILCIVAMHLYSTRSIHYLKTPYYCNTRQRITAVLQYASREFLLERYSAQRYEYRLSTFEQAHN